MKLRGEVTGVRSLGSEAAITVENITCKVLGRLSDMGPPFTFRVPFHSAKNYPIGRIITIEVTPK